MGYPEDFDGSYESPQSQYDPADLDVGELREFRAPEEAENRHPDASVPCIPPRYSAPTMGWSDDGMNRDNLPGVHGDDDVALFTGGSNSRVAVTEERAMNITVKAALKSRGVEAERVIKKELSQMLS